MKARFISDIHLSDDRPHLTDAFKTFLDRSKKACTHLFILGDLFEIWIGDDYNNPFNQEIKDILIDFTANGPDTFLMHGNRDFLIGEAFANEVSISILPDPYTLDINGMKTILSHGDFFCTDDADYIEFRNKVRSEAWKKDFLSKSLDQRKAIANAMRKDSKTATLEKSLHITDVNSEAVNNFIKEHEPNLLIHGHTHRPNVHKINNSKRIVLGDWNDYGWFLTVNDKDYELKKFSIS